MTIRERLRPYVTTPQFGDERLQIQAQMLNIITLAVIIATFISPIILIVSTLMTGTSDVSSATLVVLGLMIVVRVLLYRRQLRLAGLLFVIGGWFILAYFTISLQNGVYSSHYLLLSIFVLATAAILGPREAFVVAGISILLGIFLLIFTNNEPLQPFSLLALTAVIMLLTAVVASGLLRNLSRALAEAKARNEELRQTQEGVEKRIEERTRTLELILSLSRELSLILNQEELLREMVERVRAAFDYYYTQIYLLDPAGTTLSLVAGTGPAGQKLLDAGHTLSIGQGLVGQAAQENRPVLVSNVKSSRQWLPNPQLPDTRAEVVVPISVGDRVFGVLDVQHHIADSLTEEDVNVLQAMANQAAIALQNAGLYAAAAQRAQREAQINALSAQIQQANSIETVLQIAAEGLGKALPIKRATVYLQPAGNQEPDRPVPNGERN